MTTATSGSGTYDELTGLLNLTGLDLLAIQMIARSTREAEEISLACFRVVVVQSLDARSSELARNASLVELSGLLRSELRGSDVVARVHFDELAVLLPDTGATQARTVIEQLSSVAAREGSVIRESTIAEIGISTFDPRTSRCDLATMLEAAHLEISFANLCWS